MRVLIMIGIAWFVWSQITAIAENETLVCIHDAVESGQPEAATWCAR